MTDRSELTVMRGTIFAMNPSHGPRTDRERDRVHEPPKTGFVGQASGTQLGLLALLVLVNLIVLWVLWSVMTAA